MWFSALFLRKVFDKDKFEDVFALQRLADFAIQVKNLVAMVVSLRSQQNNV